MDNVAQFAGLDGEVRVWAEPEVWCGWSGEESLTMTAYVTLVGVKSLKEGRVPATLATAMERGFEFEAPEDYAGKWSARRKYASTAKVGLVKVRLVIEADIADDAESCRKVQTGVELEPVAKYEIICD